MKPLAFSKSWILYTLGVFAILYLTPQSQAGNTIHVNTPSPGVTGLCSLQEAIYSTEFATNIAISHTDPDTTYTTTCEPGTGDGDTIVLKQGEIYSFSQSWDGDAHNIFGPTATPLIFSNITIEGNGATLQWTGTGNSRLFAIGSIDDPDFPQGAGSLTLSNVYIKGFHVKGGDGGTGAGGGLGAGGAIYVADGELTVENSTFENNGAVGGNGGSGDRGGGGGISGNGGSPAPMNGGGGAGGGGGSRGDGGAGGGTCAAGFACVESGGGGGGGGTVLSGGNGGDGKDGVGGSGGYRCGGNGGDAGNNGHDPSCPGAGGGGGGGLFFGDCGFGESCHGDGAQASYGGGGGGGVGDGGHGGFGGGGGASGDFAVFNISGGDGGFGGGGGAAQPCGSACSNHPGKGGPFGGRADTANGGGGGALGGAIFNQNSTVKVRNSTFYNNYVSRGAAGCYPNCTPGSGADNGGDSGGAIFSLDGALTVQNSTITANT